MFQPKDFLNHGTVLPAFAGDGVVFFREKEIEHPYLGNIDFRLMCEGFQTACAAPPGNDVPAVPGQLRNLRDGQ